MSLGNDLAKIRNKQGLSIEDIKKSTRIPTHIIASIEDDSILEQLDNYTTYTRSYIRSYAKAIGIKEEEIVTALDRLEQGNYQGGLLDQYDLEETDQQETTEEDQSGQPEKKEPEKPTPPPPAGQSQSTSTENLDWVRVGMRAKTSPSKSSIRTGLLVLLVVVALVAGGFIIYSLYYTETNSEPSQPAETQTNQPPTPSDSLRQALINSQTNLPPADTNTINQSGSLPDTLSIAIYAADGNLEPVRVYTDILEQRNPYWVAEGDTLEFNFVNTVHVRAVNQYDRLQLLFNGHVIQNFYEEYYNEESGQVELDREVFENHPEWHSPSP